MIECKWMRSLLGLSIICLLHTPLLGTSSSTSNEQPKDTISKWTTSFRPQLILNHLSLTNWASGGESSISAKSTLLHRSEYKTNGATFIYDSKFAFGIVGYGGKRIEKTEDRMDFNVSLSHRACDKWSYTSMLTFKSQFANGYKYPNDSTLISTFMAPGFINTSLGIKHKPNKHFEIFFSPASGKFTLVLNQELADKGAFGVRRAVRDSLGNVMTAGRNLLGEFGMNFLANVSTNLGENIELTSTLNLYNNYLDDNTSNRWNIDVDWETNINFNINKFLQTVLFLHLKYDHNTKFPNYQVVDGVQVLVSQSPKVQFKESIGIALTYKI
jgi:hypothetical protein